MSKCSVNECFSVKNGSKSFFNLPSRPETAHKWLNFLALSGKKVHENVLYRICENHFESSDIKVCKNKKKLKPNVIPTILMPKVK